MEKEIEKQLFKMKQEIHDRFVTENKLTIIVHIEELYEKYLLAQYVYYREFINIACSELKLVSEYEFRSAYAKDYVTPEELKTIVNNIKEREKQ